MRLSPLIESYWSASSFNTRDCVIYSRDYVAYPRDYVAYPRDYVIYPRDCVIYPRDYVAYPRDYVIYPRDYDRNWKLTTVYMEFPDKSRIETRKKKRN
jgi:hypothetical protein